MSLDAMKLTSEQLSDYYKQFPDVSELSSAATALVHLGRIVWQNRDLRGSAKEWCLQKLSDAPDLHDTLMKAHTAKDFQPMYNSESFSSFDEFRLPAPEAIEFTLEDERPTIARVVNGELTPISKWKVPDDVDVGNDVAEHVASLDVPSFGDNPELPVLLLQGLGTFGDDPTLCQRLESIFHPGAHTFLVNTSGSGKTRLLFEGLCHYWGIYFTSTIDSSSLGSGDVGGSYATSNITSLPSRIAGGTYISAMVLERRKTARRIYSKVLLAKLLVFRLFVRIASQGGSLTEEHKRRWLLLQLCPTTLLASDIFCTIIWQLVNVSDSYIDDQISEALKEVNKICCSMPSGRNGLFIALDETNHAVQQHKRAFEDGGGCYPILKEMMRTWRDHSQGSITMVIAGTEIPKSIFEYEPGEWKSFRWCSDTGGFDDEKSHAQYISTFLPPSFRDSESGKELICRMWIWLRGRHRATATFITILLRTGFRCPHAQLNDYIEGWTRYVPDAQTCALDEPEIEFYYGHGELNYRGFSFSGLVSDLSLRFSTHEILLHYLVAGEHPSYFAGRHIHLVSSSVGRITDTEMSKFAMDEPLNIVAAAHWFTARMTGMEAYLNGEQIQNYLNSPRSLLDFEYTHKTTKRASFLRGGGVDAEHNLHGNTTAILPSIILPQRPHSTAPYIALYIAHAFGSTKLLSEVFAFPSQVPSWAQQTAELVTLYGAEGEVPAPVLVDLSALWKSTTPLVTRAKSFEQALGWLNHRHPTSFCIPFSPNSDLVFVLRLADKRLIWVVVHSSVSADIADYDSSKLEEIFTKLLPQNMFYEADTKKTGSSHEVLNSLESLPDRCTEAGPYSILRVLTSFPSQVSLDKDSSIDSTMSPIATLNTSLLQEVMTTLSGSDLLEGIVTSALGKRNVEPKWDVSGTPAEPEYEESVATSRSLKRVLRVSGSGDKFVHSEEAGSAKRSRVDAGEEARSWTLSESHE